MTSAEVKAGLLYSDSGPGASPVHGFRSGVQARFELANAEGGVNGRKLTYAWRDDATDPSVNLIGARQLVENEEVFGVMEGLQAGSGSAQYLDEKGIPVTGFAGEAAWSEHQNMFSWHYYSSEKGASTVWGDFVRSRGGARAAMVNMALSDASRKYREEIVDSLRASGISVDMEYEVTAGTTSFDALARQMKAARIDTIAGVIFPDVLAKLIPAVRAANVDLKAVIAPTGYDPALLLQLGPALAGLVVYINFVPFEANTPAHTRLLNAMTAYATENQTPAQEGTVFGWLSADMFIRGLQEAGPCPTRQGFIDSLRKVRSYDGGGLLLKPVDFATNIGQLSDCYAFVQVSDDGSQFVPLQPIPYCGKPVA
ncbi:MULTISPECIES: ABC transporter substrate-binding protein [Protofrankia]|uniref:ABC transporter substrate-binding protein n=1 Tax=Protofrankia TaxID=2994361 RepID=UPI001F4A02D0|nr:MULTISPECIES: ABC transporter substrate-binding protein [Protofrankia]